MLASYVDSISLNIVPDPQCWSEIRAYLFEVLQLITVKIYICQKHVRHCLICVAIRLQHVSQSARRRASQTEAVRDVDEGGREWCRTTAGDPWSLWSQGRRLLWAAGKGRLYLGNLYMLLRSSFTMIQTMPAVGKHLFYLLNAIKPRTLLETGKQ